VTNTHLILENAFLGTKEFPLFQQPAYFHLHASSDGVYFELAHKGLSVACIHFTRVNNEDTWRSPARGTFAGLSFSPDVKPRELFFFLEGVESSMRSRGAKCLEVLPPPQAHDTVAFAQQFYLLRSLGFEISQCDLNQSLEIDSRSLSDRMTYGNLKRLRKCTREGLIAQPLQISALPQVYETLAINRTSKGNNLSMTMAQLKSMIEMFPNDVILFGCPHGDRLAAAALCLRLSPMVLYVFYWGDRPDYSSHSPVVALADAVYRYGQEQGFRIMDVGTSTIDRAPNFGLLEFKRGLGFNESLKLRVRKVL